MTEMGLIKKWMENSLGGADKCSNMAKILKSHERTEVALNLRETATFFFLVLAGLVATGLIFGIEILIKKAMWKIQHYENEIVQHEPHGPGQTMGQTGRNAWNSSSIRVNKTT